jgi:hypothetical protein
MTHLSPLTVAKQPDVFQQALRSIRKQVQEGAHSLTQGLPALRQPGPLQHVLLQPTPQLLNRYWAIARSSAAITTPLESPKSVPKFAAFLKKMIYRLLGGPADRLAVIPRHCLGEPRIGLVCGRASQYVLAAVLLIPARVNLSGHAGSAIAIGRQSRYCMRHQAAKRAATLCQMAS